MNNQEKMTCTNFLAQYKGEWSPSDGLWLGMDFLYNGDEYRFQTDSMYTKENITLPDGREARYYMYKKLKDGLNSKYELLSAFSTTEEVVKLCLINGKAFGQILDNEEIELLGQD